MGCFNGFNNWLMTRRITYVKFEHNQILRWPPTYGAEVASLMYFMQWVVIGLLKKAVPVAAGNRERDAIFHVSKLKKVAQRSASKKI